jgi:hypothetical protein
LRIYRNSIKKKREREREGDRRGERGGWKEGWCTEGESLARKEGKNEERKGPFILWMMRKRKTGRKQRRNEGEEENEEEFAFWLVVCLFVVVF